MIPVFDSFEYFAGLFPLLLLLVPALLLVRAAPARHAILTVSGLYLLFLIAPRLALFHLVFWLVVAAIQPIVSATGERRAGLTILWSALAITLLPVVLWKVWPIDFVVEFNVWTNRVMRRSGSWLEALDFTAAIIAPIGLSFGSFRAADLLIKSHLGLVDRRSPGSTLAYGLFPPLLVVGPIASYDETQATLAGRVDLDHERALRGSLQILVGLFKVFVIAYLLDWSLNIFVFYGDNPAWRLWIGLIAFTWFFYVNFAGYSDMAIGAGTLLGANLRPNFDRPYQQTTPSAFWNSWHISLTRFLRMNVFTPLVAGRPQRQYLATTITMLLIALWHGVNWATLVFGLYHSAALVGHRMLERRRPPAAEMTIRWLKSAAVFAWFGLSLPLLQLELGDALDFYGAMLGGLAMNRIISLLTERLGLFRTWGSFGRVAVWVVVWCVVASLVIAPRLPEYTDRETVADVPPSAVRYIAPLSRADLAGYLPPADDADVFKLAWIGGSEVKLREVSVPGAFDQRLDTVGGRPLVIDSYNVIAPRAIEVLRAVDTAIASGADAIIVALNPAWTRSEWSMRDWANLDVSNIGTLWSRRSTWAWAVALTSPADYGWRVSRAAFPLVEAQTRLSQESRDGVDALDIVLRPDEPAEPEPGDPRLPPNPTAFWLVQEYGPEILDDVDVLVGGIMQGVGPSQDEAEFFAHVLVDELAEADIPAFLYTTPFAPESLADPTFDARARAVEAFWQSIAADVDNPLIEIESRSLSRDYASAGTFLNNVHMADPGPFADVLAERLCTQWRAVDPTLECT